MQWIDAFYSPFPSLLVSVSLLAVVGFLSWRGVGRQIAVVTCILLLARYMVWRGLYTLNLDDGMTSAISLVLFLAETYGFVQFCLYAFQAWSPTERQSPAIETYPTVDIMVTVVDEPLYILKRTLIGCLAQDYPSDRLEIYVLDDGQNPEAKALASDLGVSYLTRADRIHAKAGNLNEAMKHSSGDLIVVLDVDHIPMPNFLQKTVGFFADEDVAIVQTAQDFYNPDIFQRSIAPGRNLFNEQKLFFRTLQAGRDRHNSAFFAGSGGLLRRSALEEIGGFQTQTITEDLHTSVLLHARGYKSCYLNEALTTGLMPESFESHTKQRARWANGLSQVMILENPLFKKGLTWSQRLDYFGAIHFFYFGVPRIIFLLTPLSWLLFSIPAIKADTYTFVNFFFSAYLASILAIKMISRNTRSAFWSDVYETAMCFTVARATIIGLFSANRPRKFDVTPKGSRSETPGFTNPSLVGWHIAVFGLLIFGIANGVVQWFGPNPVPGLSISLWWASFNVILLIAAIMPAREPRQIRDFVRRVRNLPCVILDESNPTDAEILDVSESGLAVRISSPRYALHRDISIAIGTGTDHALTLRGTVVRQELERNGQATIGVEFDDLDEGTIHALINESFSTSDLSQDEETHGTGVLGSIASLLSVLSRLRDQLQPSRRRTPRLSLEKSCRLEMEGAVLVGTTRDASFAGVTAAFPGSVEIHFQECTLSIGEVELIVNPIKCEEKAGETLVRFQIETITKGEPEWQAWHQPSSL